MLLLYDLIVRKGHTPVSRFVRLFLNQANIWIFLIIFQPDNVSLCSISFSLGNFLCATKAMTKQKDTTTDLHIMRLRMCE